MDRSQLREIKSNPEDSINRPRLNANGAFDDDILTKTEGNDDQQAQIHRRVHTHHSIKSLSGRKPSSKQTVNSEVRNCLLLSYFGMFVVT